MSDVDPLDEAFEAAVDATPGTTYRRAVEGDQPVVSASDGCEALTGYDPSALDGDERGWLDVVHPDDREQLRGSLAGLEPGDRFEEVYRIQPPGGGRIWLRDRGTVSDERPGVVDGLLLDVTEQTERDRDLEAESQLLDAIFESIPVHLFVKDREGVHVKVSDFLDKSEPYEGKTDLEISETRDGHSRRSHDDDMRVIEEGEPIIDKEEYVPEIDQWSLTSKVPWRDEDGEVVGLIGVSRDITERKRAQQALEEKTERLEEFADVVAHDIRNPLTVANGHLDLAQATGDADHVEEVVTALDRADAIIDDVLALSRHGHSDIDPEPVSMQALSHGAAHSVSAPKADISLAEDVAVRADRSQLRRLLENLFKNAVQHGGADVSVDVCVTEEGFVVEDDGPGIPPEERDQVFEANYTTHEAGTGYGLTIVEEIADAHGWTVEVTDGTEGGARFEFTGVDVLGDVDP